MIIKLDINTINKQIIEIKRHYFVSYSYIALVFRNFTIPPELFRSVPKFKFLDDIIHLYTVRDIKKLKNKETSL